MADEALVKRLPVVAARITLLRGFILSS